MLTIGQSGTRDAWGKENIGNAFLQSNQIMDNKIEKKSYWLCPVILQLYPQSIHHILIVAICINKEVMHKRAHSKL